MGLEEDRSVHVPDIHGSVIPPENVVTSDRVSTRQNSVGTSCIYIAVYV